MKRFVFVAGIALAVWIAWFFLRDQPQSSPTPLAGPEARASANSPAAIASPALEASTLADTLNSPSSNIAADLQIVSNVLEAFRSNFLQTGNPVGENVEITAALTGRNPLHLALVPPDHPAINARGELCDRWGTPFFFHQISGTQMEIRSAGPDKKFHTEDDAVLTP